MLDISASCYAPKFSNRFVSWSLYLHPHDCWRCEWIFLLWVSKPMHHSFVCGAISFEKVAVYTAALSRPCKSSQFVWILLHPSTSSRCHDGTTLYDMSSLSSGKLFAEINISIGSWLVYLMPQTMTPVSVSLKAFSCWAGSINLIFSKTAIPGLVNQESCCSAHAWRQSEQSTKKRRDASSWPACAQVTVSNAIPTAKIWCHHSPPQNLNAIFF